MAEVKALAECETNGIKQVPGPLRLLRSFSREKAQAKPGPTGSTIIAGLTIT